VLKSASEEDDKGNYLPAKRDVYKEAMGGSEIDDHQ
jgi:hypothetical protein